MYIRFSSVNQDALANKYMSNSNSLYSIKYNKTMAGENNLLQYSICDGGQYVCVLAIDQIPWQEETNQLQDCAFPCRYYIHDYFIF